MKNMSDWEKAEAIRVGVQAYLVEKYGRGRDLTWHELFCATRELYILLVSK